MRGRSIDVVVPSVRLNETYLLPITELHVPTGWEVRYWIVGDDPAKPFPAVLEDRARRGDVTLIRNGQTMGAGGARNRGLDAGTSDFVVFIDDDVLVPPDLLDRYVEAIAADADESPGYVGVTRFPPPSSAFVRGVVASDILTFFDIALTRESMTWGVTANLCLRRAAIGTHRFDARFPRGGGGEDIDLCLRMLSAGKPLFRCVPRAVVVHPWWNRGRRHYTRFFRWSYGDSLLPTLHPTYRFRTPPTLPEALLAAGVALAALAVVRGLGAAAAMVPVAMILIELVVEYLKLRVRGVRVSLRSSLEATLVRASNELGRLIGHLRARRVTGLFERFDYFGTGESVAYERKLAAVKTALWIAAFVAIVVRR